MTPSHRVAADNARRQLTIVGLSADPRIADASLWRSGGIVAGVESIVVERGGAVALQVDAPLQVQPFPRPPVPEVAGDVHLAGFNLENLFNGDGRGGGFPTPRGARTADESARQLDKLVATIHALHPDVAALMELETTATAPIRAQPPWSRCCMPTAATGVSSIRTPARATTRSGLA